MKIGIVGASGMIGSALRKEIEAQGDHWVGFSRSPEGREGEWRKLEDGVAGLDAVVNLAGESVAQRWTDEVKKKLRTSRVDVTADLVAEFAKLPANERPKVLCNTSGVGYYGSRGDEVLAEEASAGQDFLAQLCVDWEAAALKAESLGVRVAFGRIGVVLGEKAEAWQKMEKIFKLGGGGKLGNGEQYWSWVHLDDVVGGFLHVLKTDELKGPVNFTSPQPLRNADFTKKLADALSRPAFLPVPKFALKVAFGGFGEALLASQRALPKRLQESGYQFRFATLQEALAQLVSK